MKQSLKIVLKDKYIFQLSQLFFLIMLVFILILIWKWNALPPELPLFYSLPRGNEQLGKTYQILFLPLFSLIFFMSHFLIAAAIVEKEKLAAKLLITEAVILSLVFFLTFIKIVFLIA